MNGAGGSAEREAILDGSIPRALFGLGWPLLATIALDFTQGFIIAIWCGQLIGSQSLAALSVLHPLTLLLGLAAGVIHIGVQVQVARSRGRRDDTSMPILINGMYFGAAWALLVAVIGLWQLPALTDAVAHDLPLDSDVAAYLRPWLAFYGASLLGGVVIFAVSGTGWTRFGLARSLVSIGFMLAMIPLFIVVFDLGLTGVSLSDGTADLLLLVLAAAALYKYRDRFDFGTWSRDHWRVDLRWWGRIAAAGAPLQLARAAVAVSQAAYITVLASDGSPDTVGGFGLILLVTNVALYMPVGALGSATGIMVGQNIGAGNHARARAVVRVAVIWGAVLSVLLIVLSSVARPMFRVLTDDATMIDRAEAILGAMKWAFPGMVLVNLLLRAYAAVAKNLFGNLVATACSLCATVAVFVIPGDPIVRVTTVIVVNACIQLVLIAVITERKLRP